MAVFKEYRPAFFSSNEPLDEFTFTDFDDLCNKISAHYTIPKEYDLCRADDAFTLMIVSNKKHPGYTFWVVGFVKGFDLRNTTLKCYKDPYYTECKMPKIFGKDDKDIESLLESGKEVSSKLEINPPDMEFLFSVDDSWLSHRQPSQIVWKSFCVAYQHFHYVGYQEDLYYMVALIQKYLDNCSEFKTDFGFTRYDERLFSDFILKKDPEKYSEIIKKVDEYYKCYIDTVMPQLDGIKNSCNGRFDCDNFVFYFKIGLFVRLYLEDFFGVHKDLPDFSKITL